MLLQTRELLELLLTEGATEGSVISVCDSVCIQRSDMREGFLTDGTAEWFLPSVDDEVSFQILFSLKLFFTNMALMFLVFVCLVGFQFDSKVYTGLWCLVAVDPICPHQ